MTEKMPTYQAEAQNAKVEKNIHTPLTPEQLAEQTKMFKGERTQLAQIVEKSFGEKAEAARQRPIKLGEKMNIKAGDTFYNLGERAKNASAFLQKNDVNVGFIGHMIAKQNNRDITTPLSIGEEIYIPNELEFQKQMMQNTVSYEL